MYVGVSLDKAVSVYDGWVYDRGGSLWMGECAAKRSEWSVKRSTNARCDWQVEVILFSDVYLDKKHSNCKIILHIEKISINCLNFLIDYLYNKSLKKNYTALSSKQITKVTLNYITLHDKCVIYLWNTFFACDFFITHYITCWYNANLSHV